MRRLGIWLDERLHMKPARELITSKTVPRHRHSFWYIFGGLALFFLAIQFITGVLLLLYYSPTPDTAYESVTYLTEQIPFGWLLHSLHRWSSYCMVAAVFVHFFSTFFMKAYRKPRELTWISGLLLLFTILGFAFTGYLLPWDTASYFATQIGTEIPRSLPLVGDLVVRILRCGEYVTGETLKRLFALHIFILPFIILGIVSFHIILNFIHGSSIPIGTRPIKSPYQFYPEYILREATAWIIGLMLLFSLVFLFPVHPGVKAEPLASAPVGIKPEWYFLPLYQTLRMLPSSIIGLPSEVLVNIIIGCIFILLLFIPWIDRKAQREEHNLISTVLGGTALMYMILMIGLAYLI